MKSRRCWFYVVLLTAMVAFISCYIPYMTDLAKRNYVIDDKRTKENLRAQEMSVDLYKTFRKWGKSENFTCYEYMSAYYILENTEKSTLEEKILYWKENDEEKFLEYSNYIAAAWKDLKYFPVPSSSFSKEEEVSFVNSWMFERTFGGKRGHEGTDMMASINQRGIYPIVSITDGVVEQCGWLPKGGYRIGIRSPSGGYFYYAHMYDYAKNFTPGDEIKAGELLGFMGDSGYSEIEGTVGNFDVHLHMGIYVNLPDGSEMSINSFWPLKYLEEKKLTYNIYYEDGSSVKK